MNTQNLKPNSGYGMNIWTLCFLSFLQDRKRYQPGHFLYPKDYESYLTNWYHDFCND